MPNFDSFGFNGETSNGDGKLTDDITFDNYEEHWENGKEFKYDVVL